MELRDILAARAALVSAVRSHFAGLGFVEVTTPVIGPHPNLDPNVRPISVVVSDFSGAASRGWLHTSPELAMKKLLAAGSGSIFQIGPVFRDGEVTRNHRCEFTMLEWYHIGADYETAIQEARDVIRSACRAAAGSSRILRGGRGFDLDGPWEEVTMAEAFQKWAGIKDLTETEMGLALRARGYTGLDRETSEGLFTRLYVESVEPRLGADRPTVVRDFPAFLGTMARPKAGDPATLERFEVYVGGLELANGYVELADPVELRLRLEDVRTSLQAQGVSNLTLDEGFLEACGGLPPCAGVSVGVDRLLMLAIGAEDIGEVVFPYE